MIERASEFGASTAAPLVAGDSTFMTAGDMLREAREAHGLHIDMVAAALKVPTQKLQALEDDDIDALPDPVFARALAASVARALRIDPAPVLAKLPGALRPGLADADRSISTSFHSGAPRSGRGSNWMPSRALWTVVGVLLVGAAALFWLPPSAFERLGSMIPGLSARGGTDAATGDGGASSAVAPAPEGTVTEPVAAGAGTSPAAAPAAGAVPAATEAAPASAPAASVGEVLVFVARADSWITVTEAGGKQLLRRTVQAGERVGLSGALPLSVVVGRAAGIDVQVRGKPFDLTPLARSGGVARFEVKS